MSEDKSVSNLSVTSFWHRAEGTIVPLHRSVGIDKIVETKRDRDRPEAIVHFTIRPSGMDFLESMGEGSVEIRYDAIPLDNPHAGNKLVTLSGLNAIQISMNTLNPLEPPPTELSFTVKATCRLEWHAIKAPISSGEQQIVMDLG